MKSLSEFYLTCIAVGGFALALCITAIFILCAIALFKGDYL